VSGARAVVFADAGRVTLRDVTLRPMAADEVAVATQYSSISAGTERLLYDGKLPGIPGMQYPLVPGYEAAGTVTAVGADVHDVRVGDDVFVGGARCYTDVAAAFGGQASHLIKSAAQVVPLHGIPLAHAPLLALAATSLHGVERAGDVAGKRCAVIGMGAIGQFVARFLIARGAVVFEADVAAERLGRIPGVAPIALDAPAAGHGHGHGHGHAGGGGPEPMDIIFECTGKSELLAQLVRMLRPRGSIVILSYYDRLETSYPELFVCEPTLVVAREWDHADLIAARDAVADGRVRVDDLASEAYPVERYESAYQAAFFDPSTLKVILRWA
jgi:3-hydroxyethyl bacteriochlorophyllide a dehydrogenase